MVVITLVRLLSLLGLLGTVSGATTLKLPDVVVGLVELFFLLTHLPLQHVTARFSRVQLVLICLRLGFLVLELLPYLLYSLVIALLVLFCLFELFLG